MKLKTLKDIEDFIQLEAEGYGLTLEKPLVILQGPQIDALPPMLTTGNNMLSVILGHAELGWLFRCRRSRHSIDKIGEWQYIIVGCQLGRAYSSGRDLSQSYG